MSNSLRVPLPSVLNTRRQVDATAGCVDFAGLCGRVMLSAEVEINVKITASEFRGTLAAWAHRSTKVLVPTGFSTSFDAVVAHRNDFVCRTGFRSRVQQNLEGELYVFSYGTCVGDESRRRLHLRSEASTVVLDQFSERT